MEDRQPIRMRIELVRFPDTIEARESRRESWRLDGFHVGSRH
jgi:hypothetical protein